MNTTTNETTKKPLDDEERKNAFYCMQWAQARFHESLDALEDVLQLPEGFLDSEIDYEAETFDTFMKLVERFNAWSQSQQPTPNEP